MAETRLVDELLKKGERSLLRHKPSEAASMAHSTLANSPENPRALHLAGLAAAVVGDFNTATECLASAVAFEPHRSGWLADLAAVLFSAQRLDEAEEWGLRAVEIDRECRVALDVLAKIASCQGRDYLACRHLKALAAARPDDLKIRARLALAEYAAGDVAEAIRLLRELLSSGAADQRLHSEYVSALLYDPLQTRESLRREFEGWALRLRGTRASRTLQRARNRSNCKLRIGYMSGEFAATPSRHFLLPILRNHNHDGFEITCYHTRSHEDVHTTRFREFGDRWRSCAGMDDDNIAALIQDDKIDILVDLSGHLRHHRLAVFTLQPAPVQVAYPNHPATTGVTNIRYILSDQWVCPEGYEAQYTEKVHLLHRGYLCYEPPAESPPIAELTRESSRGIVFGLFQRSAKLNSGVWDAIAGILNAIPNSRLLIHDSSVELDEDGSEARERVERELALRGIAPARAFFRGWLPLGNHLKLLSEVDVALDTFPYNGATTTCECLWMGVPVVTLIGETHASRVGYELLDRIGLSAFVATNSQEYVSTAVIMAQDRDRLRSLRLTLRDQMRESTLLEPKPLVREIEDAYTRMWQEFLEENR